MSSTPTDNLRDQLVRLRDRYALYHNHKETMAYGGFAVYLTATVSALLSKDWPPAMQVEPWARAVIGILLITAGWALALWFIGWQLLRRRLAAVRVAAAEKLLTKWIESEPLGSDLQPWRHDEPGRNLKPKWWHHLWPPASPTPEGDVADGRFPAPFVAAWRSQAATGAVAHEKGICGVGWALWALVVFKTLWVSL